MKKFIELQTYKYDTFCEEYNKHCKIVFNIDNIRDVIIINNSVMCRIFATKDRFYDVMASNFFNYIKEDCYFLGDDNE